MMRRAGSHDGQVYKQQQRKGVTENRAHPATQLDSARRGHFLPPEEESPKPGSFLSAEELKALRPLGGF